MERRKEEADGDANAEFDQWLPDDGDWGFGDDIENANATQTTQQQKDLPTKSTVVGGDHEQKSTAMMNGGNKENVETVESNPPTVDDDTSFANWDDDPFADDPLFGADEPDSAAKEAADSNAKQAEEDTSALRKDVASSKQIENGLEAAQQPAAVVSD